MLSAVSLQHFFELARGNKGGWKGEDPVPIICSHQSIIKLWRPHCSFILKVRGKLAEKKNDFASECGVVLRISVENSNN